MRRNNYRYIIFFIQLSEQLPYLYYSFRIQTIYRLIQNHKLRSSHKCIGKSQSLSHSEGKILNYLLAGICEIYYFQNLIYSPFIRYPLLKPLLLEILSGSHLLLLVRGFYHETHPGSCMIKPLLIRGSVHLKLSGGRKCKAAHDLHDSSFACTIRTYQTYYASLSDAEGYIIKGLLFSVLFGKIFYINYYF